MKKWLLLVPLLLGLSLFCSGQAVTTLDQNCNLWGAAPATPQCGGTTSAASGTQLFFPDLRGTITNQFEVLVQGTAPATLTVTVVGCMRGGTCSATLASSSGTASQILTPATTALNVYDKYGVTVTWTGGDVTTRFVVNRTGTVAKLSGSGGNGTVTNTGGTLTANAVVLGNGGSDTKVSSGLTTDGIAALTQTQGTITSSNPFVNHSVTWNAGGVAFTNWLSNITCTAAAVNSIPLNIQVGGASQVVVKFVTANCVSPTLYMGGSSSGYGSDGNGAAIIVSAGSYGTLTANLFASSSFGANGTLHKFYSSTAPSVAAAGCGGSAASVTANNGTAAFTISVGTTNSGTCTVTMPAASTGWVCNATDVTTNSTSVFLTKQSGAGSTTSVTLKNFSDVAANGAWTDSDVLAVSCFAY